ncbi:hypothetical protein [Arthrobacter alpinus]|uniref:hypothetical protein n=1 Tax=Arthrobacter alpinus TaxID=656366 RepID=UPI000ABC4485|nr:hypothetical protein [Arthrobacter alpinus]
MDSPLLEVIAEALAYENCKRVNPKADHPIMGYHTFHPDQREFLRDVQMSTARAVMAAIAATANVDWGVRWSHISEAYPERTDWGMSQEAAQAKLDKSFADGTVVSRVILTGTAA